MKFEIWDCMNNHLDTVTIHSLRDLMDIYDEYGQYELVINFDNETIIIYDGYLE